MGTNIVIVGAGYAGVLTAKKLSKQLRGDTSIHITLIDKNPYHSMLTELHEVAAGRVEENSIKMSLRRIFAGRGVNVVLDRVESVDWQSRRLKGERDSYPFDYLVICTGSRPTFYGVKGAAEYSFKLWSVDDAVLLREKILGQFRLAAKEPDAGQRRRLLAFYIAGAGLTGVEMAGELAEWVPFLCDEYEIDRSEVGICVADMVDRVIPSMPGEVSRRVANRLKKMGVHLLLNTGVTEVREDTLRLKDGDGERDVPAAAVIWTAGVEGSGLAATSGLELKARGRIQTDRYLRAEGRENVFVAGDNLFFVPEGETNPVPQMVENCEHSAETVAHNIAAAIRKQEPKPYRPVFHGTMVCVGGRWGAAHVGTAKKSWILPSFLAMACKHLINLVYFVQVLGWNKIYSYLCHEFFGARHNRSFLGGHFANKSPNFWLVPLRLFLGARWMWEGGDKLWRILQNPNEIFLFNIPGDAVSSATQAADTVSSATQAVAEAVAALPVPGFLQSIVDWSMVALVAPVAPFVQFAVSAAEFLAGGALMIGLFTPVAAAVSCVLCAVIYSSGMAPFEILWYFFAGIACIGGSGSVFGADYYVFPWLKRRWKKLGFARKWYLYND